MDVKLVDIEAVMKVIDSVDDIRWYLRTRGPINLLLPSSLPEAHFSMPQERAPVNDTRSFATVSINTDYEVVIRFPDQEPKGDNHDS